MQAESENSEHPAAIPPRPYFRVLLPLSIILLLASLTFHLRIDAHTSMRTQWQGVGFIISSMLAALLLAFAFPAIKAVNRPRVPAFGWIVILTVWVFFYLVNLKTPGPWSEEVWWTELGRFVASGGVVNPIGFKGDHPANFQAWPVGLLMALTGDSILSTRLPGAFYALGTVYFVTATTALYCSMRSAFGCWILGLLSISALHYSQSGWNEMNSAPFLVSIQFYLLSRALICSCRRSLLLLGCFAGFAFWSLYTPALFSLIAMGFVMIAPSRTFGVRMKALSVLCFLLLATPTFGKMLFHSSNSLGRHEAFLKGGEWQRQFDDSYRPLPTYLSTLRDMGRHILPATPPIDRTGLLAINLEMTSMALLAIGFMWIAVRLDRWRQFLLYGNALLLAIGITLTNPSSSTWREFSLWSPLMLIACLGLQAALNAVALLSPRLIPAVFAALLGAHVYFFGAHYLSTRVGVFGDYMSDQVSWMYAGLRPYLDPSRKVYFPDTSGGWFARLLASPSPYKLQYHTFKSLAQIDRGLENSLIVTLAEDPTMPSAEDVSGMLKGAGLAYKEVKVIEYGTTIGTIFVIDT